MSAFADLMAVLFLISFAILVIDALRKNLKKKKS